MRNASVEEDELEQAVATNHGDNLVTVMDAIRHETWEYRALFDSEGRKVSEGTLQASKCCNIPREDWQKVYQYAQSDLHNHPSDNAFSSTDVYGLIKLSNVRRDIVVTPSFNYIMEKTYQDNNDAPDAKEVKAYMDRLFGEGEKAHGVRSFCWHQFPRLYSCYVSHSAAQKFGLKFTAEDLRLQKLKAELKRPSAIPRRVALASPRPELLCSGLSHIIIYCTFLPAPPTSSAYHWLLSVVGIFTREMAI